MTKGASPAGTGLAGAEALEPHPRLHPTDGIPCANEPEWLELARDTIAAVSFQRGTRGIHVVGKDGRVRLGCVDLLGMYAVDEMARKWAAYLGVEFPDAPPVPSERQAMMMVARKKDWRDWLTDPNEREMSDEEALAHLASAGEAFGQDRETGLDAEHEHATAEGGDAHNPSEPSHD